MPPANFAGSYGYTYPDFLDMRQCSACGVWWLPSIKFTKDTRALASTCDDCFGKPVPSTALTVVNPA